MIKEVLEDIRHLLPTQSPLKDFIHHNTLHAFQHLSFEDGVHEASLFHGTRKYLSKKEYDDLIAQGKIDPKIVENVRDQKKEKKPKKITRQSIRNQWCSILGVDLDFLVNPLFFRLSSQFLDQGIAFWTMPGASDYSFYECIQKLTKTAIPPLPPLTASTCQKLLALEPEEAVKQALSMLVEDKFSWGLYIQETLFAHPGWSGLVSEIEKNPDFLPKKRRITLLEYLAVKLILEVGIVYTRVGKRRLFRKIEEMVDWDDEDDCEIFQKSLEETYYNKTLQSLLRHDSQKNTVTFSAQVLFCIDDRECSLRRHLESVDPSIETYGLAGFFGIDAMVLKEGELFPVKSCPAPVSPKHLIVKKYKNQDNERSLKFINSLHGSASKSVLMGLIQMPLMGILAVLRLVFDVFNPLTHAVAFDLNQSREEMSIHIEYQEERETSFGRFQLGYTPEEMANRVGNALKSIGLVKEFAPFVFVIAHGSSSVNNPYFAAYDCGACSGKPGAPNAKAFSMMANRKDVREILRTKFKILIPDETRFIGGIHNTTKDEIEIFEKESNLEPFKENFERALSLNAQERCKRFELASKNISPKKAREHVRSRALSIFEPRPELNHATNAACIVGRRKWTRGLFLDRRAFLQSYDPTIDLNGDILTSVLSAVIPVCGGINLEYYFSRIDPEGYGSGTKLPHNVVSLLGVVNGAEGDILTGLPTQMTEFHDPIRLMLIVEQKPEVLLSLLEKQPSLKEWVFNEWVQLFVLDTLQIPGKKKIYRYQKGEFFETARIE